MSKVQENAQISATEGTVYIPFKLQKPPPKPRIPGGYHQAWARCQRRINDAVFAQSQDTIDQLIEFAKERQSAQDSGLGVNEIPTALVVGRDRALLSALLAQVAHTLTQSEIPKDEKGKEKEDPFSRPLVVQLNEGDCGNATSALKALIAGFLAQFEETDPEGSVKKKASTTLAAFDMARLVAGYDDYYTSRDFSPNLVVILDQLESFDTDVIQDLVYTCSKHLDSLPILFILTLSETAYLQRAFTTPVRMMLDTTVFQPPSGAALCSEVIQKALYDDGSPRDILLGESSIKILKDIINNTDGRIDALITTLQQIYMEHYRYQGPMLEAVPHLNPNHTTSESHRTKATNECIQKVQSFDSPTRDALMALMFLYRRRDPLSDGFRFSESSSDTTEYTEKTLVHKMLEEREKTVLSMRASAYALGMLHFLTWGFDAVGSYRQEVPLSFLDLLELDARGDKQLEKYATWMLKKGFESTSTPDTSRLAQDALKRYECPEELHTLSDPKDVVEVVEYIQGVESEGHELSKEAKTQVAETFSKHLSTCFGLRSQQAYSELYYTDSTNGLKSLLDPAPRSSILSALIRPGAYFGCECCDPDAPDAQESMSQRPDTCALFQRSLEAGKLLNVADWFGAFVSIMQDEKVSTGTETVKNPGGRTRRATTESELDHDEGSHDLVQERQARFLHAAHELEYLGLIQATGRRKEHVLRTVFEMGD